MHIFAYRVCIKFISLKLLYVHCLPIKAWWSQYNHHDNQTGILFSSHKVYLCVTYGPHKKLVLFRYALQNLLSGFRN